MKVDFTDRARTDLRSIKLYVAKDNPRAASSLVGQIRRSAEQLSEFPFLGHAVSEDGTRELAIRGRPYLLVYEVKEDAGRVLILNIFHTAQDRSRQGR